MTGNGAEKLRNEVNHLKSKERPRIIKAIAEARAHGDLKENAEYHAAREKQSFVESRIIDLEDKLARAEIMEWIAASERFQIWNEHMQSKMELKSFQSSITKALVKAGFTRNSAHGRYIKWLCPPDIYTPQQPTSDDDPQQQPNEEEGDDDDDGRASDEQEDGDDSSDDQDGDENKEGNRPQYQSG